MSEAVEAKALELIEKVENLLSSHAGDAWEMAQYAVRMEALFNIVPVLVPIGLLCIIWKGYFVALPKIKDPYHRDNVTTATTVVALIILLPVVIILMYAPYFQLLVPDAYIIMSVIHGVTK